MLPDCLRAVCFDIGGVLVRVPRGFLAEELAAVTGAPAELTRRLLIEHGKRQPTTPSVLAAAVASGTGAPGKTAQIERIIRLRDRRYTAPQMYPDAVIALQNLTRAGWRICFLSNATGTVSQAPALWYFRLAEIVLHSWETGYCKPETGTFRAMEQRMGLRPHELVCVGDSVHADIIGAQNAGWSAIYLPRTSPDLQAPENTPVISALTELPALMPAAQGLADRREGSRQ